MEQIMQEIWKEVLNLEAMPSTEDSFFDLGGNSFLAVQVIEILEKRYKRTVDIVAFYECENIKGLVERIEKKSLENGGEHEYSKVNLKLSKTRG